jgi:hypothetical protein
LVVDLPGVIFCLLQFQPTSQAESHSRSFQTVFSILQSGRSLETTGLSLKHGMGTHFV